MKNYKLLTPGPLTTTDTVKGEMMFDHCTWDDDYKQITQEIRKELLKLAHVSEEEYTAVLMQGSGTFGVESVLTSVIGKEDKLLIAANGAYGERMADIAEHAGMDYVIYNEHYDQVPKAEVIREMLEKDPSITHVAMVHSETTSGILNNIEAVGKVVKSMGKVFIVDAMSSFAGVDIPVKDWGIDFIISGTFGVESVLTSVIGKEDKLLIAANGAYGERMADIAEHAGMDYVIYNEHYDQVPKAEVIREMLEKDPSITHVAMVHSETTSGILNNIEAVGKVVKSMGKVFIVDAMSSFAGVDIPVKDWGIDFIISSANKCIQGVPGFSFIIADRKLLTESKGKARSLSLDLYDQWKTMEVDGKWRFTSPTHVVLAFAQALKELKEEGGIPARSRRYKENNQLLIKGMKELGIHPYIDGEHQGPIITTFFYPENYDFKFADMYTYIKDRGYAIYPGKVTEAETFRIGNIGEIYKEDIERVVNLVKEFLDSTGK